MFRSWDAREQMYLGYIGEIYIRYIITLLQLQYSRCTYLGYIGEIYIRYIIKPLQIQMGRKIFPYVFG